MRILLSGGGTAGHVNPAIAIAEIVKAHDPHAAIAFVGTPHGMENRLVRDAGYPIYHVNVHGFSRSLSLRNLGALWLAAVSPLRAKEILREFHPDIVVGTGGYVSWPILRAAAGHGIKTAVHESNAIPGMAVRRLAPLVDEVWLNFLEASQHLPQNSSHFFNVGNPIRAGFQTTSRREARHELGLSEGDFLLLSFGGSLGAEEINRAVLSLAKQLLPAVPRLRMVHAAGRGHYESVRNEATRQRIPERLTILPYIDKMAVYMGAADAVISRAGAMTLSELSLCGKCAILIPSPHVTGNHQYKNAAVFRDARAAALIEESALRKGELTAEVKKLLRDPGLRQTRERAIRRFAKGDAGELILERILFLLKSKK